MVETRTSQLADKKDNGKSPPKSKPSKLQIARQTAAATEGLRRSTRDKRGSAKAREAATNASPPSRKPKKPRVAREGKKKADSSANANSGPPFGTIKEAAPPRKKSKTGRGTTLDPAAQNALTQLVGEGKRRAVEGASKAADRRTTSKSSKDLVARRTNQHVTVTKESDHAPTDQMTSNNVPGRTSASGDTELIEHRTISNEPASTSTDVNIVSPEQQVSNNRRHSPSREFSPAGATQIGDQDDARDTHASTVPSGLRRDITREALFHSGWETANLGNDNLRSCCVEQLARLPSPIADFGNRHDELTALLEAHVHRGVLYSYEQFAKERRSLRDRLQSNNAILNDGTNGKFIALTDRDEDHKRKGKARLDNCEISSIEIYSDTDQNPGEIHIPLKNLFLGQPIVRAIPSYSNTRKNLIIRRLPSTETGGDIGYFIINHDIQLLALNESAIGTNMIAGPLPDFALITIGHLVGFWWRTPKALDHIPAPQGRKRKRDNGDETEDVDNNDEEDEDVVRAVDGDGDLEISSYGSDSSLEVWKEHLNERLEHFRKRRAEIRSELPADKLRTFASRIKSSIALADEEVIIGIATVWEGLRNRGRLYAYGGLDVFISTSDFEGEEHRDAVGVVGGRNDFIMPLFFPSSGQIEAVRQGVGNTEGDIGHWVLAVAHILPPSQNANNEGSHNSAMGQRNGDDRKTQGPLKVGIRIFDSAPRTVSKALITQTAQDLVQTSGWLGNGTVAQFERSCVFENVPNQAGKANTCGFHVILNAWSVMLDIAVCTGGRRRNTKDSRFYSEGLEIMNLALAGFMDSATIQAFLIVHGYAAGPYPRVQSSMVNPVAAARLDQNKFKELLQQQSRQESAAAGSSSGGGAPADKWKQLRELVSSRISDERLSEALIKARGKVDEAADNLYKTTPSPTSTSTNIPAPGATAQREGGDEPRTFAGSNTEAAPNSLAGIDTPAGLADFLASSEGDEESSEVESDSDAG